MSRCAGQHSWLAERRRSPLVTSRISFAAGFFASTLATDMTICSLEKSLFTPRRNIHLGAGRSLRRPRSGGSQFRSVERRAGNCLDAWRKNTVGACAAEGGGAKDAGLAESCGEREQRSVGCVKPLARPVTGPLIGSLAGLLTGWKFENEGWRRCIKPCRSTRTQRNCCI